MPSLLAISYNMTMKQDIKKITKSELAPVYRKYLSKLTGNATPENCLAIYLRQGNEVYFIEDCLIPASLNSKFEKEAPAGLYRAGSIVLTKYNDAYLVVPDERYACFKPVSAGTANFNEGYDLELAAKRELSEELFLISLGSASSQNNKLRKFRYLPVGAKGSLYNSALDLTAKKITTIGRLKFIGHYFNETNRAFEALYIWDISAIKEPFTASLNEEWHAGGNSGISIYTINTKGRMTGAFSGQQGFQTIFDKYKMHSTLRKVFEVPD